MDRILQWKGYNYLRPFPNLVFFSPSHLPSWSASRWRRLEGDLPSGLAPPPGLPRHYLRSSLVWRYFWRCLLGFRLVGSGDRGSDIRFVVSVTVVILIRFVFANNRDFSSRHVLTTAAAASMLWYFLHWTSYASFLQIQREYVMKMPFPYKKNSVILVTQWTCTTSSTKMLWSTVLKGSFS